MEIHLRTTGCRLPYGITQCLCHPTQANTPRLNSSQWRLVLDFLPRRDWWL